MVITVQIWFGLRRFRKDFPACKSKLAIIYECRCIQLTNLMVHPYLNLNLISAMYKLGSFKHYQALLIKIYLRANKFVKYFLIESKLASSIKLA